MLVAGNQKIIRHPLNFANLWLTMGWFLIALVVLLSLWPMRPREVNIDHGFVIKLGHLIAYLILILWFANIYPHRRHRLWASMGFMAMGVCLEFAQLMIPGRTFLYSDMISNTIGVLLGLYLAKTHLATCLLRLDTWLVGFD